MTAELKAPLLWHFVVFLFPKRVGGSKAVVVNPLKNQNLSFSSNNSDRCLEIKLPLATDGLVEPFVVGTQICAGWLTAHIIS